MRRAKLIDLKKITITDEDFTDNVSEGQAMVKVRACGLCGTDLHIFSHGREDVSLPRVMGHELSGEVVKVGHGVKNIAVGDRVVLDPVVACGECDLCKKGHKNVCSDVKCFGVQMDGGFQDYIVVNAESLYKIPDKMTWEEAALVETFSIAANIIDRARIDDGEVVLIFGAGPIGLSLTQALKGIGARIIVADMVDNRLEKAVEFGAEKAINAEQKGEEENYWL